MANETAKLENQPNATGIIQFQNENDLLHNQFLPIITSDGVDYQIYGYIQIGQTVIPIYLNPTAELTDIVVPDASAKKYKTVS
jgi:hypothetical protein